MMESNLTQLSNYFLKSYFFRVDFNPLVFANLMCVLFGSTSKIILAFLLLLVRSDCSEDEAVFPKTLTLMKDA